MVTFELCNFWTDINVKSQKYNHRFYFLPFIENMWQNLDYNCSLSLRTHFSKKKLIYIFPCLPNGVYFKIPCQLEDVKMSLQLLVWCERLDWEVLEEVHIVNYHQPMLKNKMFHNIKFLSKIQKIVFSSIQTMNCLIITFSIRKVCPTHKLMPHGNFIEVQVGFKVVPQNIRFSFQVAFIH